VPDHHIRNPPFVQQHGDHSAAQNRVALIIGNDDLGPSSALVRQQKCKQEILQIVSVAITQK
jgi:hypothetical protein